MKSIKERLGQRIARQRRVVGLTQAELAERANVQPETICRIESGKRTVSLGLLVLLAESLDLELHELLRFQNTDSPKERAVERLLWFGSRLTVAEIELVLDVGATLLVHTRRTRPG